MKTIGIIGGGQLGRMMTISAKQMGHKVIVLDPGVNSPCGQVADEQIVGNFNDLNKLEVLCKHCDVVTYEFENIPYDVIQVLEKKYNIPQGYRPLYISQNRYREKENARKSGLNLGKYKLINSNEDLDAAIKEIGYPCVLKTCELGYDGKGQVVLKDDSNIDKAHELIKDNECILEEFIHFEKEVSVIIVKSINGETSIFPIPHNIHKNNILHQSIVPSNLDLEVERKVKDAAMKLMDYSNFVGILAIELFIMNGEVYFNEMAPRPHNSGHYTIEGCYTSQFEQLIRAILGNKLGDVSLKQPTIMVNILGQDMDKLNELTTTNMFEKSKLHLYGKEDIKINRKMGHVTFFDNDIELVKEKINDYLKTGGKYE